MEGLRWREEMAKALKCEKLGHNHLQRAGGANLKVTVHQGQDGL